LRVKRVRQIVETVDTETSITVLIAAVTWAILSVKSSVATATETEADSRTMSV